MLDFVSVFKWLWVGWWEGGFDFGEEFGLLSKELLIN